ncbi:hypothetical protein SANTM175S_00077 [Streptomyces antimycoticus]
MDLPAGTAGRAPSDLAFDAAGLGRDVAFEVTGAHFLARLVGPGLGVAMHPSAYVPHLAGVVTIEVADAPARVEYVIWSRFRPRTHEDKHFRHPRVGELHLHFEALAVTSAPGQHLSVYSAEPGSTSGDGLILLRRSAEQSAASAEQSTASAERSTTTEEGKLHS